MDVVRICSELVKIKSENPPGDTREAAEYIALLLDSLGIRSDITEGHRVTVTLFQENRIGH